MGSKVFFLVFLTIVLAGSLVCAETVFPGETFGYGRTEKLPINFSEIPTVNSSDNWITNIGVLSNVDAVQHNNVGGTLTIDETWFESLGDTFWLELNGGTMNGTINMDGNILNMNQGNITNINQLQAPDGSAIKFGNGFFDGIGQAINIQTNQTLGEGVVTHVLTDVQGNRIIEAWQSGKNNSWGFHRNSYGIFGDLGLTNASLLTDALFMWNNISIDPFLDYDTATQGASLGVQYGIETQKIFIHDDAGEGQALFEGLFRVVSRDGDDIDLYEAPVHILDLSIKEFGFDAGDNLTLVSETFESGTLGIFTLITSGKGVSEWAEDTGPDCPPNGVFCAGAGPTGGSGATIMQTNFSTTNLQDMSLNFTINTEDMSSGGDFEVTANNNIGSGDVVMYSLTGSDELDATITAALPASMEDESIITMSFSFLSTHPIRGYAWVDQIVVNATTSSSTLVNVTVPEGEIEFGDGDCRIKQSIISSAGESEMNISCDNINLIGNVTQTSVTEVQVNVTGNIDAGGYINASGDIVSGSSIFVGGENISDIYFRLDGTTPMQGNANWGGFNLSNLDWINGFNMINGTSINGTEVCDTDDGLCLSDIEETFWEREASALKPKNINDNLLIAGEIKRDTSSTTKMTFRDKVIRVEFE